MEIRYRLDKDNLYIYSYGELDECTAANARKDIDRIIDENAFCESVVFDFANLSFMDSTGIGVLIGRYKKIKKRGGKAYIARPSFTVNKISQISGLYDVMPKII